MNVLVEVFYEGDVGMAPTTPAATPRDLVRAALASSVRKDLQKAAKSTGACKANGTNAHIIASLNDWLKSEAEADEPRRPAPQARSPAPSFGTATPSPVAPSCASLGISGLKDDAAAPRRESTESLQVTDLADELAKVAVDDARPALGDVDNVLSALPTDRGAAIKATGPAAEWRGTHVRFD
jgi:hypothetical protein